MLSQVNNPKLSISFVRFAAMALVDAVQNRFYLRVLQEGVLGILCSVIVEFAGMWGDLQIGSSCEKLEQLHGVVF